jgi:hypothetical protein
VPIVVVLSHGPASLIGMHLRYRYRVEPTGEQRSALAKAFGCARVVYNDGLRIREDAFKAALPFVPDNELLRIVTTEAKKIPERRWLAEVSAVVLQQSVADLNRAYRNGCRRSAISASGGRVRSRLSPLASPSRSTALAAITLPLWWKWPRHNYLPPRARLGSILAFPVLLRCRRVR